MNAMLKKLTSNSFWKIARACISSSIGHETPCMKVVGGKAEISLSQILIFAAGVSIITSRNVVVKEMLC